MRRHIPERASKSTYYRRRGDKTWLVLLAMGAVAQAGQVPDTSTLEVLEARLAAQQQQIDTLQREIELTAGETADQASTTLKRHIREVLADAEFRSSLTPATAVVGYDGGFYIRSTDELFHLRVNANLQTRWTSYITQEKNRYLSPRLRRDDRTGFDLTRIRVGLRGHVYDKNLTYLIEMRADSAVAYDFEAFYAYFNYRFSDEFQITTGLFKLASTRSQILSESEMQLADRPISDAVFSLDRGIGVRFWGDLLQKKLTWYVDVVNGFASTRDQTITPDPALRDNTPALLAKLVWHALGEDYRSDFRSQADLPRHPSPALDFGLGYAFSDDAFGSQLRLPFPRPRTLRGGGFAQTTADGVMLHQVGADAAFKYDGLSVTGEYLVRFIDPRRADRAPWTLLSGAEDSDAQQGAYLQVGYFLPIPGFEDKIEAVARVGGVSLAANDQEGVWDYGGGVNYYIEGNRVKLQAGVTRVSEAPARNAAYSLANLNDDALIWTVQLQVGF